MQIPSVIVFFGKDAYSSWKKINFKATFLLDNYLVHFTLRNVETCSTFTTHFRISRNIFDTHHLVLQSRSTAKRLFVKHFVVYYFFSECVQIL